MNALCNNQATPIYVIDEQDHSIIETGEEDNHEEKELDGHQDMYVSTNPVDKVKVHADFKGTLIVGPYEGKWPQMEEAWYFELYAPSTGSCAPSLSIWVALMTVQIGHRKVE